MVSDDVITHNLTENDFNKNYIYYNKLFFKVNRNNIWTQISHGDLNMDVLKHLSKFDEEIISGTEW